MTPVPQSATVATLLSCYQSFDQSNLHYRFVRCYSLSVALVGPDPYTPGTHQSTLERPGNWTTQRSDDSKETPTTVAGRVKPMTLKLILVASEPNAQHYQDRLRTGLLSVRIMQLGGISGHGVVGLVSQWDSTIKLP